MVQNPYQKYQQQSVMTMTLGDMLSKVYGEAIKQLYAATSSIETRDYYGANKALQKVQRIFNYLNTTLDFKYPISEQLSSLYEYFVSVALKANIKKDSEMIKEIIPLIEELREAYRQADQNMRAANAG